MKLEEIGIKGTIPSALGQLTHLSELSFLGCGSGIACKSQVLSGTLPSFLGQLTQLTSLTIIYNDGTKGITGTIPPELGQLTQLKELWLSENSLTGTIPSTFAHLTQLHSINLEYNHLTGVVPPLPSLFQAGNDCCLTYSYGPPYQNHFSCALPAGWEKCVSGSYPGLNCTK
jgi:Leucine-rich repeat (LRR) protein